MKVWIVNTPYTSADAVFSSEEKAQEDLYSLAESLAPFTEIIERVLDEVPTQ